MLAQLRDHFGEPVKPVSEYCKAFYDWQKVISERIEIDQQKLAELTPPTEEEEALPYADKSHSYWFYRELERHIENWQQTQSALNSLYLPIVKSNFLARHVYGSEPLRTVECPEHKGHWSGCVWGDQACEYGCMYGSNVTGWLPDEHSYTRPPKDVQDKIDADIQKFPHLIIHYPERCWICGGTEEKGSHV